MKDPKIIDQWTEKCGCKKCNTTADFIKYDCGCIRVDIHRDKQKYDDCTNFAAKRYTAPGCK